MVALAVFLGLGFIAWLIWELVNAPVVDDWHDECVKARKDESSAD